MTSDEQLRRRADLTDPVMRLRRMIEIRCLEDAVRDIFFEGLIPGTTHTSQGQEAVAVGVAAATEPTDTVACTYRGHAHALALGLTPEEVLGEIMGRDSGCISGVGGSMHMSSPAVGLLPTMAIIGAGIPVAAGAALTSQTLGRPDVAISVFGDGTANIGAFHEGINIAAVWKLPVVFVCENNLYGEYSPLATTTAVTDVADRAASYGIPGVVVDGQDLLAVEEAVSTAVRRARSGEGPSLLEMKTYRYVGHSRSDQATYRPEGELERWLERDPIALYAQRLRDDGRLSQDAEDELRQQVRDEIDGVVQKTRDAPYPSMSLLFANVYATDLGQELS